MEINTLKKVYVYIYIERERDRENERHTLDVKS